MSLSNGSIIVLVIAGLLLLYRIYDVFFGSIARSMRDDEGHLNVYHKMGEDIVKRHAAELKRESERAARERPKKVTGGRSMRRPDPFRSRYQRRDPVSELPALAKWAADEDQTG